MIESKMHTLFFKMTQFAISTKIYVIQYRHTLQCIVPSVESKHTYNGISRAADINSPRNRILNSNITNCS